MRFHELKDAVSVDLDDVAWDRSKISAETDAKRFLFVCGNLVVFHERDSTVRLAHHTVGQFLDEHKRDHSKTDVRIGEICLTYLGFSDFETQVVPTSKNQDLLGAQSSRQAGFYRIPQILGLSNGVYGFILGLYNRNKKLPLPGVNYAELMRRHQKQPLPASLAQKYCLLTYVAENWIWHARSFDPKTSDRWSEFREFVFYKTLPFDFKPWDTLQGPPNLPHLSIYLWALENNHLPLLLLLRDISGHRSLRPYLEYKTLCRDRVPPHLLIHNAESAGVDFRKYPNAYDWPAMKIFLEGRTEMLELYLQEDPSIISNRHIMTRALMDANLGVVKGLLRGGANPSKTEIDATNALHSASRKGNKDFVKILLDLGADANSRLFQDERGRTPLYEAFLKDGSDDHEHREPRIDPACSTFDIIQLLLDHGADPNVKQIGEETALHKAVGLGEAYVRLLLSAGADVEARNDRQQSILDVAVDVSDRMIDVISEYEVNLEARDSEGQTALLKAVKTHPNDATRVKALIGHGANVHAKDLKGKTVLHHVCSSSDGTLLRFIELGVDVNARDQSGKTALWLAGCQSDHAKFKLLLELGAASEAESELLLTKAVANGNKELVDMLLRLGNDPNQLGNSHMSTLSLAVMKGNEEVIIALLNAGADPNLVDNSMMTPLCRAVMERDKDVGKMLIQAGADIQPSNPIPFGPLHIAIASGHVGMVEFLIQQGANVSSFRPRDISGLRAIHRDMCDFLTELGVSFKLDYDVE